MSCIRFNTPAQRQQLRDAAPTMLSPEEVARLHPVPAVTASKIRRLRTLAQHADPKIRASVASSRNAPADLYSSLASDRDEHVRGCLARNDSAPTEVLRVLADDSSEKVRGWLAVNHRVPADVMERLAGDPDETVRSLVRWKRSVEPQRNSN